MKRVLVTVLVLAGCCAAIAADSDMILTPNGIGKVRFGMAAKMLQNTLQQKLEFDFDPFATDGCGTVSTKGTRAIGVSFTLKKGYVDRINIDYFGKGLRSPVRTDGGVELGSTEDEVKQAYGNRVAVEPHPNDPTWHYMVVDSPDHTSAIILETNGKKVIHIRSGEYPTIMQPDGCV
jgi:hypothetical protein